MKAHLLDGTDLRAAEITRVCPGLELVITGLPSGYSASSPEPAERARGMVLAADTFPCLAESTDITTLDGNSLRLELDSENEIRFCRWWRTKPVRLHLCIALRMAADAEVELYQGELAGVIADKPAGPRALGWDRLFVPDGFEHTLAELVVRPDLGGSDTADAVGLRTRLYGALLSRHAS